MKKLTLRAIISKRAVMKYNKTIILSNGMECCLRNGTESDSQLVLDNFNLTHRETDYLRTYPDENSFNAAQESQFLKEKAESERAVSMYERAGFVECGRNPKGFRSCIAGFQEVISMRLEL